MAGGDRERGLDSQKDREREIYREGQKQKKKKTRANADIENRLVVAMGEGGTGSLGIADANYYI